MNINPSRLCPDPNQNVIGLLRPTVFHFPKTPRNRLLLSSPPRIRLKTWRIEENVSQSGSIVSLVVCLGYPLALFRGYISVIVGGLKLTISRTREEGIDGRSSGIGWVKENERYAGNVWV